MMSSVHRWQYPAGSPDRRAQDAITDLFARRRSPRPREGLDEATALSVVREARRYAEVMAGMTQMRLASSERVASSFDDLAHEAEGAASLLRSIVDRLCRHFDPMSKTIEDPDFLVLPIMSATGRPDQNDAREIALGLIAGMRAADLLSNDASKIREQVVPDRQNPGEAEKTSAIGELALAWVDLTGDVPGTTKCQAGSPFAVFVSTLLDEGHNDLSRQINRALEGLGKATVDLVKKDGYLARWRIGADPAG